MMILNWSGQGLDMGKGWLWLKACAPAVRRALVVDGRRRSASVSASASVLAALPARLPRASAVPPQARRLSRPSGSDEAEAKAFLLRLRYTPEVADGVISALRSSGALLPTLYAMAGAWEVGGDAGLAALAKAVEAELAASAGSRPVRFSVRVPHAHHEFECEALEGMTLRDVAEHGAGQGADVLGEYIECACSGVMACSTCHVIVDPASFLTVGPPDQAEQVLSGCVCVLCLCMHLNTYIHTRPGYAGPSVRSVRNIAARLPNQDTPRHAGHVRHDSTAGKQSMPFDPCYDWCLC